MGLQLITPREDSIVRIEATPPALAAGRPSTVRFAARTHLPTDKGTLTVCAFRDEWDGSEPVAIVVGDLSEGHDVLVRVHDACFTSEVLGSTRCDCKQQLDASIARIQDEGRGVVVYLHQEGRGVGLAAKIAAYSLQECGVDTVDANRLLGLPDDLRRYDGAAAILGHLGVKSVRLMTNNPRKIRLLRREGLVVQREPHKMAELPADAAQYIETKMRRMGHL